MRDVAMPHLTLVTAWRLVQASTTCSLEPGQHLSRFLQIYGMPSQCLAACCAWCALPASEDSSSHAALRTTGQGHQGFRAAHRAWKALMRAARMMTWSPALLGPPAQHPGWDLPSPLPYHGPMLSLCLADDNPLLLTGSCHRPASEHPLCVCDWPVCLFKAFSLQMQYHTAQV